MGDGTVRRVAVVINGSNEQWLKNASSKAANFLSSKGYELFMATHWDSAIPSSATYYDPTPAGVAKMADALKGKTDDDDEIVVFTGGHGGAYGFRSDGGSYYFSADCLVLTGYGYETCFPKDSDALERIFSLPAGRRIVVMGQCYSGNWASKFFGDPRALFVSAGPKDDVVRGTDFVEDFFRPDEEVSDGNKDGIISWRERFVAARPLSWQNVASFWSGKEFPDMGAAGTQVEAPRFAPKAHEVRTRAEYDALLATLEPGDNAFINVSNPLSRRSQDYDETFDLLASKAGGRALFVTIANGTDETWSDLAADADPTVFVKNANGFLAPVKDPLSPFASLPMTLGDVWSNRAFCIALLKRRGYIFSLRSDSQIQRIDKRFWKDRDFVLEAVKQNGESIKLGDARFRKDREVVLAAVERYGHVREIADEELLKDRGFVLEAVKRNPYALRDVDPVFHKDVEIVMTALSQMSLNSYYVISDTLIWEDRTIVLEAVKRRGWALEYADEALQKDREIVLAAVRNMGWALQFADLELRKDREIVLAAVRQDGRALQFADLELRSDREIVLAAVKNDLEALEFADSSLQEDPKIIRAVRKNTKQSTNR